MSSKYNPSLLCGDVVQFVDGHELQGETGVIERLELGAACFVILRLDSNPTETIQVRRDAVRKISLTVKPPMGDHNRV